MPYGISKKDTDVSFLKTTALWRLGHKYTGRLTDVIPYKISTCSVILRTESPESCGSGELTSVSLGHRKSSMSDEKEVIEAYCIVYMRPTSCDSKLNGMHDFLLSQSR